MSLCLLQEGMVHSLDHGTWSSLASLIRAEWIVETLSTRLSYPPHTPQLLPWVGSFLLLKLKQTACFNLPVRGGQEDSGEEVTAGCASVSALLCTMGEVRQLPSIPGPGSWKVFSA